MGKYLKLKPRLQPSLSMNHFLHTTACYQQDNNQPFPGQNKYIEYITVPAAFKKLNERKPVQAQEEFLLGARHALVKVTHALSQGHYDDLEGMLDKRLLDDLRIRCEQLSRTEKDFLRTLEDDIEYVGMFPDLVTYNTINGKLVFSVVFKGKHKRKPYLLQNKFLVSFMFERFTENDSGNFVLGFVMFFRLGFWGKSNQMILP